MKSLLVQLDDPTYRALEKVAPAAERKRSDFIRRAIRQAILNAEEEHTRQAYVRQPDIFTGEDDWGDAGNW
jgi:predicted transcriptional regulator